MNDLQLFYQYSKQYLSNGIPEKAAALVGQGLIRVEQDQNTFGEKLKKIMVRLHLLLAEALLAMSQIKNAKITLEKVWHPASLFFIDRNHEDFLWLSRLYAHTKTPVASKSYTVESMKASPLSLYDVSTALNTIAL